MLEMLRVISLSTNILRHNIIFLFNGGEENFMPASHGFITQHKWAKEVNYHITGLYIHIFSLQLDCQIIYFSVSII